MKFNPKEEFERLYDDEDVWLDFVEHWMKRNQDDTIEIVDAYLSKKMNDSNSYLRDEYADFVNKAVEGRYGQLMDEAYERAKDERS
jgi:hypothetical protein